MGPMQARVPEHSTLHPKPPHYSPFLREIEGKGATASLLPFFRRFNTTDESLLLFESRDQVPSHSFCVCANRKLFQLRYQLRHKPWFSVLTPWVLEPSYQWLSLSLQNENVRQIFSCSGFAVYLDHSLIKLVIYVRMYVCIYMYTLRLQSPLLC